MPEGNPQLLGDGEGKEPAPNAALPAIRSSIAELPAEFDDEKLPGALFGYDKYSVSKLLDTIRQRFWALWQEAAEREQRIKDLELELHRSRESQRLIGETLLAARQQAAAIREEARRSAQSLLKTARKRAEETAAEIERQARAQASELIESAERERQALRGEAEKAKAFVEQTHEQLSDFLLAAVKWYEQAKLSEGDESRREPHPSTERVSERPQLDSLGADGSSDARIAEDA